MKTISLLCLVLLIYFLPLTTIILSVENDAAVLVEELTEIFPIHSTKPSSNPYSRREFYESFGIFKMGFSRLLASVLTMMVIYSDAQKRSEIYQHAIILFLTVGFSECFISAKTLFAGYFWLFDVALPSILSFLLMTQARNYISQEIYH